MVSVVEGSSPLVIARSEATWQSVFLSAHSEPVEWSPCPEHPQKSNVSYKSNRTRGRDAFHECPVLKIEYRAYITNRSYFKDSFQPGCPSYVRKWTFLIEEKKRVLQNESSGVFTSKSNVRIITKKPEAMPGGNVSWLQDY